MSLPLAQPVRNFLRKSQSRVLHRLGVAPRVSYSQVGEDAIVAFVLENLGIYTPTYLDIGAHHPWHYNNTAMFYERGSQGVNVDANAELLQAFRDGRPRDVNLATGVGPVPGVLPFFVMQEATLSTFSEAEAQRYEREQGYAIRERRQVPVVTAASIVEQHLGGGAPDFLSIDVEGLEQEILESLDLSRLRPAVICAETIVFSPGGAAQKRPLAGWLEKRDYFAFADTHVNTIFVDAARWAARGKR